MREILFKGKRKDNDEWVYGYYIKSRYYDDEITHFIVDTRNRYDDYDGFSPQYEIDPDTVCQYTGLTDRNGTKVFENDIIKYSDMLHKVVFGNRFGNAYFCPSVPTDKMFVVGNIFDNPELLRSFNMEDKAFLLSTEEARELPLKDKEVGKAKQYWVFTFGCGHLMKNYAIKMYGTFEEVRARMFEQFGKVWCVQYTAEEFERDRKKYFKDITVLKV